MHLILSIQTKEQKTQKQSRTDCDGSLNRTRRICLLSPESHSPHATESQHRLACAPNSRRCHASLLPLKNHPCDDEDADNTFICRNVRSSNVSCMWVLVSPVAKPRLRLSTQQPVSTVRVGDQIDRRAPRSGRLGQARLCPLQRHNSRVYPTGSRINSSNYMPQVIMYITINITYSNVCLYVSL